MLFEFSGVQASQEVVYKGPRGMRDAARAEDLAGTKAIEKKSIIDQGYDPTDKTDPFKPFIAEQESVEDKTKRKPKTYLETLDISQLDLIAIVIGPQGNWAMVRDAKGLGYVIREGTPIGVHEGEVTQIKETEVVIREKRRDFRGKVRYEDVAKGLLPQE